MEMAHPNSRSGSSLKILHVQQTQRSLSRIILSTIRIILCNELDNIANQNMINSLLHTPIQQTAAIIVENKGMIFGQFSLPGLLES
jgi:hypothetical protein